LEQGNRFSEEERKQLEEIHAHQERHGDAVKGKKHLGAVILPVD
jgi:hypothetical protein